MRLHADLLRQAQHLAVREPKRPLQASLRRAISASYYALFHLLVYEATQRMFSGKNRSSLRYCLARAFVHREMKKVAQQFDLQQARHEADYDTARRFTRRETLDLLDQAQQAFTDWRKVRKSIQADTFLAGLLTFDRMRI